MATMAIDFWQFDCRKPLSRRAIQRIRCNIRRVRGDRCGQRIRNGRWSGALARERSKRHEIEQQLEEMVADDESEHEPHVLAYSQNSYQYEEHRLLEEEEELLIEAVIHGFKERARAIRLIACPGYFEDQVSALEIDPEIGGLTTALFIEEFERQALQGLAAA